MRDPVQCVFLSRLVGWRECLTRHMAAQHRVQSGKEQGFNPCLHCDKAPETKGNKMGKIDVCVDCKEEIAIISHGRCYVSGQCLKAARAKGTVPPPMSHNDRKLAGRAKTEQQGQAPACAPLKFDSTTTHFDLDPIDRVKLQHVMSALKSAANDAEEISKLIQIRLTRLQTLLSAMNESEQIVVKYIHAGGA